MSTSAPVVFEKGWEVRPCVDRLGHVTSLDIGPPVELGARGGPVIASVYGGEAVAHLMSAAPELLESLENAVDALAGFKISPLGGLDKMNRHILKARGAYASVGRNPEGHDRETGHGRNDEHAVGSEASETPSIKSGAPDNG